MRNKQQLAASVLTEQAKTEAVEIGFAYDDAIGKDAVQLLRETFRGSGIDADIQVICNDSLGVLAAGRYADPRTEIGVVLGTGTNAACVETVQSIPKWAPGLPNNLMTSVNIEWGDFSSNLLPRVDEDFLLDNATQHPDHQLFERMVCGEHLGELCRLMILSLHNEGAIFKRNIDGNLTQQNCLTCASICKIVSDDSATHDIASTNIRQSLGITPTPNETVLIKKVCNIVVERAALLLACALAATVYHVRRDGKEPGHPVVIAIDGSTYLKFEKFKEMILTETRRLLKITYGCGHPIFEQFSYSGGSCFGAAVLAAANIGGKSLTGYNTRFPELPYLDH